MKYFGVGFTTLKDNMKLFQYLVSSSAIAYPAFLAKTNVVGKSKDREFQVPWTCLDDSECPPTSVCYIIYREVGICAVTLPK